MVYLPIPLCTVEPQNVDTLGTRPCKVSGIGVSTFQGFFEMWTLGECQSVQYIAVSTFQFCKIGVDILLCLVAA